MRPAPAERSAAATGHAQVFGLPPVAAPDARVVVLGSMPGVRSLEEKQYYAHPRNVFWRIAGEILGFDPAMSYEERLAALVHARVALWDVLQSCHRPGSLDARIRERDAVANDLPGFLTRHPEIRTVAFNGMTAARIFERRLGKALPGTRPPALLTLPSTSPANAGVPYAEKLAAWRRALAPGPPHLVRRCR